MPGAAGAGDGDGHPTAGGAERDETMSTVEALIRELHLEPHPEGGYFRQTYLAGPSEKPLATAIYFLVTAESFSALHRLDTDEIYHFYFGDPVEMLWLHPDGRCERPVLGTDLKTGARPQLVVPPGVWQGSRVSAGGSFALFGTTMAPGFTFDGFEMGEREALLAAYPQHGELVRRYTRS